MIVGAAERMRSHLFNHIVPKPAARLRLFCFPYAGGSSLIYRTWGAALPGSVEVYPVELPGRAVRIAEQPYTQMDPLIEELVQGLQPLLDKPFAFFGHSMGALVSFELARRLRRQYSLLPAKLFVSAHRAPQLPNADPTTHLLSDVELIDKLRTMGGTPEEVLAHPELMQLMLPVIRADFTVCDTYTYTVEPPLDCPIVVFGGFDDTTVQRDELERWNDQTTTVCTLQMFPGGHLFINSQQQRLLEIVGQELPL